MNAENFILINLNQNISRARKVAQKDKRDKSVVKPIYIGMMTSEVEAIMGKPFEVITNNNSKNNQLWIYKYQDKRSVMLTFTNYKLIKIED